MTTLTPEQRAIRQWLSKPAPGLHACGCMGPQGNEPRCPCAMNYVEQVDGKWYAIEENRSPDGITHSAIYIGEVKAESAEQACRSTEIHSFFAKKAS